MRRTRSAALLALTVTLATCVTSTTSAQVPAPPLSAAQREVIQAEHDVMAAQQHKDRAALDRLLADEFTIVTGLGTTKGKAPEIAAALSPNVVIVSYTFSDVVVRIYGETAVITYVQSGKGIFGGVEDTNDYRFGNVWVKRDGRWQLVHLHGTRVVKRETREGSGQQESDRNHLQ